MNVYTCNDHDGRYVGAASVVVAEEEAQAYLLMIEALLAAKLKPTNFTLKLLDTSVAHAVILQDGDY